MALIRSLIDLLIQVHTNKGLPINFDSIIYSLNSTFSPVIAISSNPCLLIPTNSQLLLSPLSSAMHGKLLK